MYRASKRALDALKSNGLTWIILVGKMIKMWKRTLVDSSGLVRIEEVEQIDLRDVTRPDMQESPE